MKIKITARMPKSFDLPLYISSRLIGINNGFGWGAITVITDIEIKNGTPKTIEEINQTGLKAELISK